MDGGVSRVGVLAITVLAGALALAAMVAGGGSGFGGLLRVGGASVLVLTGLLVLFALGLVPLPRPGTSGLALVATTATLVVWTGATIGWSIVPDHSWEYFNRTVVFVVFLGLGLVLAAAGGTVAARLGASALATAIGVVLLWALLSKVFPGLDSSGDTVARLNVPVDYWNALALLADGGLVLALWLGALRERTRRLRMVGALLAYAATLGLLLTLSRAGLAAAVVAVCLWLALSRRDWVVGALFLAATALPAAAVGGWAFTRPALVEPGATHADRAWDGATFGALALLGAGVAVALVVLGSRRRLGEESRHKVGRGLLAAVAACVVLGLLALVVAVGNPVTRAWDQVTAPCSQLSNNPRSHITSLNPNSRLCWWSEAWRVFAGKAPLGAGAGSFEVARKRYRRNAASVTEPHSIPLQQLADGGVVAFLLFLGLAGSAGAACVCAVRRLPGEERAAAVGLLGLPVAYAVHALVDYDWDFLAATAPTLLALGVVAGAGRPLVVSRRRPLGAAAGALVAISLLASFSFPRLAERSNRSALAAIDAGDLERASDDANRARFLDPLSVDPLYTLAGVAARQRKGSEALRRYVQAVNLEPQNPDTWYSLGIYEFFAGNMCAAYTYLNHAYTLDSAGSQWVEGGALDQARSAVNRGACER